MHRYAIFTGYYPLEGDTDQHSGGWYDLESSWTWLSTAKVELVSLIKNEKPDWWQLVDTMASCILAGWRKTNPEHVTKSACLCCGASYGTVEAHGFARICATCKAGFDIVGDVQ